MRKYILPLLSIYLDFIWVNTLVGLAMHFFGAAVEALLGGPLSWPGSVAVSLVVVSILRLLNVSAGDWLLEHAIAERQAGSGLRQWPNLLMGTIGFLSGCKEAVRWTLPGDGMPMMFLVEETPVKLVVIFVYGLLYVLAGAMLLRFARGAKLFNFVLLGLGVVVIAVNLLFFREAMVNAQLLRRANLGLPVDQAAAEAVVSTMPLYGGIFFALLFLLIYLSRERRVAQML